MAALVSTTLIFRSSLRALSGKFFRLIKPRFYIVKNKMAHCSSEFNFTLTFVKNVIQVYLIMAKVKLKSVHLKSLCLKKYIFI